MKRTITPFSKELALEAIHLEQAVGNPVPMPVERFFIGDVSGSMYNSMEKQRENMKRSIRETTCVGDLVTIVWFSDRAGFVCQRFDVRNQTHLDEIDALIDKNMYARGCTSFVPAIECILELVKNLTPGYASSLVFMSDGHDNCNSHNAIYKAVEEIASFIDKAVIVEYGWYADSKVLHAMADRLNASYVFAERIDDLVAILDQEMSAPVRSVPSIEVETSADFLLNVEDGRLFKSDGGKAFIPENIPVVYGVFKAENAKIAEVDVSVLYALLSVYVLRQDIDMTLALIDAIGDVYMFRRLTNAFSKQDYVVLSEVAEQASKDVSARYLEGKSTNLVPDVNAPCVIDVLTALSEGDNLLNLNAFSYHRIGRKMLTGRDVALKDIQEIQAEIAVTTDENKLAELFGKLVKLGNNADGLKFVDTKSLVSLSDLTFSNSRPNVSILATIHGSVIVPKDKATHFNIPEVIPATRFRNFAIISDGIVNVSELPVVVDKETHKRLEELGVVHETWREGAEIILDISELPVINRSMVERLNSKEFVEREVENMAIKAHAKVVKYFLDDIRKKLGLGDSHRYSGLIEKYGQEGAEYLKENGLTDGGYSPRSLSAPTTEEVQSFEVKVTFKGMSSLPKVEDVIVAIKTGKTSAAKYQLMLDSVREILPHVEDKTETELRNYLPTLEKDAEIVKKTARKLNRESAIQKFILIVGKSWFSDRDDRDAFTETVDDINVTVELKETTIKI